MARDIFTYILHAGGDIDDTALELLTFARKIDPQASVTALAVGSGGELEQVCSRLAAVYPTVWKIDDPALAYPNAEIIRPLLQRVLPPNPLVVMAHEHFAMDLAPGLAVKLDAAYAPDVVDCEPGGNDTLTMVRQEYAGMVSTHVICRTDGGAVITVRPGAAAAAADARDSGRTVDKSGEAFGGGPVQTKRRYLEVVEAEVGDVDITKSDVLVSVGRGIEDEDNMEIVFALADAMGADVSCSRPIVDAKWLEKSRQVGTSGKTVKPKVYMALGISGSFQHIGGIKGNPFIVAVNKNPNAPIFQFADIGVVTDILDFIPELTDAVKTAR